MRKNEFYGLGSILSRLIPAYPSQTPIEWSTTFHVSCSTDGRSLFWWLEHRIGSKPSLPSLPNSTREILRYPILYTIQSRIHPISYRFHSRYKYVILSCFVLPTILLCIFVWVCSPKEAPAVWLVREISTLVDSRHSLSRSSFLCVQRSRYCGNQELYRATSSLLLSALPVWKECHIPSNRRSNRYVRYFRGTGECE